MPIFRKASMVLGSLFVGGAMAGAGDASPAVAATVLNASKPQAAPEFVGLTNWVNAKALTLGSLRGKVVLVDFWTFGCINCQRTLPYLKEWYAKFHSRGFEIVGVHTPELSFERSTPNVRKAVARLGITYPVAIDPAFATWNAYENQYWPAEYFIDKKGRIRHYVAGEGGYQNTPKVIEALLDEPT